MENKKQNSAHSFTEGADYKKPPPPSPPPPRTITGNGFKKGGLTNSEFESQIKEREKRHIEKETEMINIVGGIAGIAVMALAWIWFGWKMPVVLILTIMAITLINHKQ